jgi:hypothetical protein
MSLVDIRYVPKPDSVAAFGCDTKEQLRRWRPEICGVCCLKMIGDTKRRTEDTSLWQLTTACVQQGAFTVERNTGAIEGIFYRPLIKVAQTFGLKGFIIRRLPLGLLRLFLLLQIAPLLSINLHKFDPQYAAGHLVVVVGYDKQGKLYTVHDPSSVLAKPGRFAHVSSDTLKHISNNRGVVLY